MNVIFENTFTVSAYNFDGLGSAIPVQFTAFYCAIGGIPSITFNMSGESFYELCRYMSHDGKPYRKHLPAAAFINSINDNRHLEGRTRIDPIEDLESGIYITRFIARHAHSQRDCAFTGGEQLVKLLALADIKGLTPWQRRRSYHNNLQHCHFNAAMHDLFAKALAAAVVMCTEQHPAYGDYLDYIEGLRLDAPENIGLTPNYFTNHLQGAALW